MKNFFYFLVFGGMAFLTIVFIYGQNQKNKITFSYQLFDDISLKKMKGYSYTQDTLIVDGNRYIIPELSKPQPRRGTPQTTLDVYILLDGERILLNENQNNKLALILREKMDNSYKIKKNLEYIQKEKEKIRKQKQQKRINEILD
ncbi:MAG: hypothetical protein MRY57_02290 [Candidatus Pacebacteria bacterium]|nr:hypothetical protein [Candidatus Paceibacterota bacterium]